MPVGYQVQTIEEEYRFAQQKGSYNTLFTVQWQFLGQGRYGNVGGYDFWTALGVVGGYIFLATQLYRYDQYVH